MGIPVFFGAYLIFCPDDGRDRSVGLTLLVYAIALGSFFAFVIPEGKLVSVQYKWRTPIVILLFFVAGALRGGLKKRSNGK
ncbi:hypothetical protein [Tateyamaria sp.]|uniref:hypothetical protein n=1 Tax=Tateyamaria sp. TaxID=1929288 RepID=UPI00329EB376